MTMLEEKVKDYKALAHTIDELETQKKALGVEILQLMPNDKKNMEVAGYTVKKLSRLSIKTTLEVARLLDAVKTEEVVDKDRIKELYKIGHPIPDVTEYHFIQVTLLRDRQDIVG